MTNNSKQNILSQDQSLLDQTPPAQIFSRHIIVYKWFSILLLSLLTSFCLYVSFAPFNLNLLAYVALVPWVLAVGAGKGSKKSVIFAWLSGVVFWMLAVYWIMLPTIPGYILMVLYLAGYWLIAAIIVRKSYRRGYPMWIVLPIVWTALEFARSNIISFPWFLLGQTQYQNLNLIQICDVTGQLGVSFFVGLINGIIVDVITGPLFCKTAKGARVSRWSIAGLATAVLLTAGLLGYGYWRNSQYKSVTSPGPKFGVVQDSIPIILGQRFFPANIFMGRFSKLTLEFDAKNPDTDGIVWPETMLDEGLNIEFLQANLQDFSYNEIASLAQRVFGYNYFHKVKNECEQEYPNSKVYQERAIGNYFKRLLVRYRGAGTIESYYTPVLRRAIVMCATPANIENLTSENLAKVYKYVFRYSQDQSKYNIDNKFCRFMLSLLATKKVDITFANPQSAKLKKYFDSLSKEMKVHAYLTFTKVLSGACSAMPVEMDDFISLVLAAKKLRNRVNLLDTNTVCEAIRVPVKRAEFALMKMLSLLINKPIIAGGTSYLPNKKPIDDNDLWCVQNSVLWFDYERIYHKKGAYAKQHLVPFSEEVPFKYSCTWLYKILKKAIPPQMHQIQPGDFSENSADAVVNFTTRSTKQDFDIVTPVCFEGTIPPVCRNLVNAGSKKKMVMINLSNDGWFVHVKGLKGFLASTMLKRGKFESYQATTAQSQHLMHYVFRAIESRVPVVRSVNTGITSYIDSAGRVKYFFKTTSTKHRKKTMVSGALKVSTNVDSRCTMYATIGDSFAVTVAISAISIVMLLVFTKKSALTAQLDKSGEND